MENRVIGTLAAALGMLDGGYTKPVIQITTGPGAHRHCSKRFVAQDKRDAKKAKNRRHAR